MVLLEYLFIINFILERRNSMMEAWLTELVSAFISLLYQPLLYWAVVLTFFTAYVRRKKERYHFGTSLFSIGAEWRNTWILSLILGILFSVLFVLAGVVIPYSVLFVISIAAILLSITGRLYLLSPAYYISLVILIIWGFHQFEVTFITSAWLAEWGELDLTVLLALAALGILLEIILSMTAKREHGFVRLIKGKRGKYVGQHILKRLFIIPFFVPIPLGAIEPFQVWWPIFPLGDESNYGLILFPLLIGIQQSFQSMFVDQAGKFIGKWLLLLAIIGGLFVAGSIYYPVLAIVGAAVLFGGRLILFLSTRFFDVESKRIFTPQPDGLLILSVIPHTPAEKMGLKIGEKIEKVNQRPVQNESEFYDALQENRTFCKLEVRTLEGEIRFVQGPLYEGDHHELGLVFIKEKPRFKLFRQEMQQKID
jgi:hypothetical protein